MNHVIGLIGYGKSGKDTALESLNKFIANSGIQFQRIAFADPLKKDLDKCVKRATKILKAQGVSADQIKEKIRPLYEFYGTTFIRSFDDKAWLNIGLEAIKKSSNKYFCVTDVRNINEGYAVMDRGILINIERPGCEAKGPVEAESIPLLISEMSKTPESFKTITNDGKESELGEKIFYSKVFQNFWRTIDNDR